LLQEVKEPSLVTERLGAIDKAATQCAQLTGQLLAFGRKQHLRPQLISLNELIRGDERIIRSLVGPGVDLTLDLGPEVSMVRADPVQIQRVLANLVSNARDAMPDGGKLIVSTSNLFIEAEGPAYPGVHPGQYVRLSVS